MRRSLLFMCIALSTNIIHRHSRAILIVSGQTFSFIRIRNHRRRHMIADVCPEQKKKTIEFVKHLLWYANTSKIMNGLDNFRPIEHTLDSEFPLMHIGRTYIHTHAFEMYPREDIVSILTCSQMAKRGCIKPSETQSFLIKLEQKSETAIFIQSLTYGRCHVLSFPSSLHTYNILYIDQGVTNSKQKKLSRKNTVTGATYAKYSPKYTQSFGIQHKLCACKSFNTNKFHDKKKTTTFFCFVSSVL